MSVEFEPVRLGARRRRVDPVAVGAAIVAIALVVSIVKPWDVGVPGASPAGSAHASPGSSGEAGAVPASSVPTASIDPPRIIAARATLPPTWGQVEPVIRLHEAWGVRAIVVEASGNDEPTARQRFAERWFGFPNDGAAGSTAVVDPGGHSIVALGVTFPPSQTPLDVRIWRETREGLAWIDTESVDPVPSGGAFLYVRPGIDDGPRPPWASGSYRVDVLVEGSVLRFGISIPDRFSNIREGTRRPNLADLRRATDASRMPLPDVPLGLFAIADRTAIAMPADVGGALDETAAWLDLDPGTQHAPRSFVAAAHVPRATRLGVMLESRVVVMSASIVRLAPEPMATIAPIIDHTPRDGAPSTSVTFRAPGGRVWEPGVYRITVVWRDFDGQHEGSWHAELRPGPVRELPRLLSAARSWARFAGADGVILGTAEPLVGGPATVTIRLARLQPDTADYPVASAIGCGATIIEDNPRILGFAYSGVPYASTVRATILRPFLHRGDQVVMTAAFGLRGLILVAPARRQTLTEGNYRFTVGEGEDARVYALCLGMPSIHD